MGSQVPDVPVRFAASFGRRLLYDPNYNKLGPVGRCAWFEANLIATEYDGRFPLSALEDRLTILMEEAGPTVARLKEAGMITIERNRVWARIVGWEKWQADPLEKRHDGPMTPAEKQRAYRARKRVTGVTNALPGVTTPARASESSSSSMSKHPARARPREAEPRRAARVNGDLRPISEIMGSFESIVKDGTS